jgi:arsenite-transporting ATPase
MGRDSSVEDKVFGNDAEDEDKSRESGIRSLLNRRRLRFTTLRDKISDKKQTSFVIVLAAERLPVLETIELQQQLKKGKISVDCLVVNKRSPIGEGEFLEERRSQEEAHMKTLTKALPKIPRQDLYLLAQDIVGIDALQTMAERIAK